MPWPVLPGFLVALRSLSIAYGIAELSGGLLLGEPTLLGSAALTFVWIALLHTAAHRPQPSGPRPAAVVGCGIAALGCVGAALIPDAASPCAMLPVLSVALILPPGRKLRPRVAALAIATSGAILLLGQAPHPLPPLREPLGELFEPAFAIGMCILVVGALNELAEATCKAMLELHRALARQLAIFERSPDAMLMADDDGRLLDANPAAERLLGLGRDRIVGRSVGDFTLGEASVEPSTLVVAASGRRLLRIRGVQREATVEAVSSANVHPGEHLMVWRDVTNELRQEEERAILGHAVDGAADAIAVLDRWGRLRYANAAFAQLFDRNVDQLLGRPIQDSVLPLVGADVAEAIRTVIAGEEAWSGECSVTGQSGRRLVAMTLPRRGGSSDRGERILVARDVTTLRQAEHEVERITHEREAIVASLRSLRPRQDIDGTAEAICRTAARLPGVDVAAIGTFEGPGVVRVLAAVGLPIAPGEYVPTEHAASLQARAEQGAWYERCRDRSDRFGARLVDGGVRAILMTPIEGDGGPLAVLLMGTTDAAFEADLVAEAAAAGEFALAAQVLLGPGLEAQRRERQGLSEVGAIIERRLFAPVFQPIVDLARRRTVGYEALTRFLDGRPADATFAAARHTPLGPTLERHAVAAALAEASTLAPDAWISVNVSPALLLDPGLGQTLAQSTHPLVLEITEHDAVSDYEAIRGAIARLGPNVRVAVDDAGAGVANFRHLIELRPDFIKADASLIRGIDRDPFREALVAALEHFGRLGHGVLIAEGIETEEEHETLRRLDVPLGQGYLLARPAPAATWSMLPGGSVASAASVRGTRHGSGARDCTSRRGPGRNGVPQLSRKPL